jgi:branched-chain amino acid transport system permease protein
MGVGIYAGVIAASLFKGLLPDPPIRLIVSLLCGGVAAGVVGFLVGIPALRLRGDYLAIVTLAFGEILRNILQNLYVGNADGVVRFAFSDQPPAWNANIVNGAVGIRIPMDNKIATFLMSFILVLFTLFVVFNIINSKEGRAIKAVRDNRIAAESVGINVTAFRMKAFVVSAALAGMAGALYGLNMSSIAASKFNFNTSINILVFVVLGGMGNILGSVISATVLYILPEAMRELEDYRMILYAVVLILVMLFTWSPKFKEKLAVLGDKLKKMLKKGGAEA